MNRRDFITSVLMGGASMALLAAIEPEKAVGAINVPDSHKKPLDFHDLHFYGIVELPSSEYILSLPVWGREYHSDNIQIAQGAIHRRDLAPGTQSVYFVRGLWDAQSYPDAARALKEGYVKTLHASCFHSHTLEVVSVPITIISVSWTQKEFPGVKITAIAGESDD